MIEGPDIDFVLTVECRAQQVFAMHGSHVVKHFSVAAVGHRYDPSVVVIGKLF